MRTIAIPINVDASGDATATRLIGGEILAIGVDTGTLATNVDITITDDLTASTIAAFANLTTATKYKRYPKVVPTQPDGTALTTAGPAVPPVSQGRIKVVVAQGGVSKSGTVWVTVNN